MLFFYHDCLAHCSLFIANRVGPWPKRTSDIPPIGVEDIWIPLFATLNEYMLGFKTLHASYASNANYKCNRNYSNVFILAEISCNQAFQKSSLSDPAIDKKPFLDLDQCEVGITKKHNVKTIQWWKASSWYCLMLTIRHWLNVPNVPNIIYFYILEMVYNSFILRIPNLQAIIMPNFVRGKYICKRIQYRLANFCFSYQYYWDHQIMSSLKTP